MKLLSFLSVDRSREPEARGPEEGRDNEGWDNVGVGGGDRVSGTTVSLSILRGAGRGGDAKAGVIMAVEVEGGTIATNWGWSHVVLGVDDLGWIGSLSESSSGKGDGGISASQTIR